LQTRQPHFRKISLGLHEAYLERIPTLLKVQDLTGQVDPCALGGEVDRESTHGDGLPFGVPLRPEEGLGGAEAERLVVEEVYLEGGFPASAGPVQADTLALKFLVDVRRCNAELVLLYLLDGGVFREGRFSMSVFLRMGVFFETR